jgi:hypothetical protein
MKRLTEIYARYKFVRAARMASILARAAAWSSLSSSSASASKRLLNRACVMGGDDGTEGAGVAARDSNCAGTSENEGEA